MDLLKSKNISHKQSSAWKVFSNKKIFMLVCFLIFISFYVLNIYYPLRYDDWLYSFGLDNQRISSLTDIFRFQYDHYMTWGGRTVAHTLLQLLLWMGEGWGDLVNSIAILVFVIMIYLTANINNRTNWAVLIITVFLLWFLQAEVAQTFLWITGSANYLWCCLFSLLFLYPFCSYYLRTKNKKGMVRNILFLFAGIIAGWTNENMSVAVILFIIAWMLFLKYDKRKIPLWAWFGLAGAVAGCVLVLAAPGNYIRYETVMSIGGQETLGQSVHMKGFFKKIVRYYLLPCLLYGILLFLYMRFGKDKNKRKRIVSFSVLFFLSSLSALVVMYFSPKFPNRAWFGIITYIIVAMMILYANLDFRVPIIKRLNIIGLITGTALFIFSFTTSLRYLMEVDMIFSLREKEIERQKNNGSKNIILHGRFESKAGVWYIRTKVDDLPPQIFSDWTYKTYANYHGVESIIVLEK